MNWAETNQQYLTAELASIRGMLERHAGNEPVGAQPFEAPGEENRFKNHTGKNACATIDSLQDIFGLSPFERDLLLLCAGMELDAAFAPLCAAAQDDPRRAYPTFSLALAALTAPHWSALTASAPLRRWRLIELGSPDALTSSPLRIDERILHYIAGVSVRDERLAGLVEPVPAPTDDLTPSHRALADRLATLWSDRMPVLQLCGPDPATNRAIAWEACRVLGMNLQAIPAHLIPAGAAEMETLIRLWEREAALSAGALLVEWEEQESAAATRFLDRIGSPVLVSARERRRTLHRAAIAVDVPRLTAGEQLTVWRDMLGTRMNGKMDELVSNFALTAPAIRAAGVEALARERPEDNLNHLLWDACRTQARHRLDDLAQRIEPAAGWDDLVLPEIERGILRDIAAHVRQRAKVYETWGFGSKGARGLGISALFAGASGTGKTMAAEVLAGDLRLDLYRIDLSAVVSKYIGETEKNLRRVFDAAEEGGAILLFDEADALFGKRSEVKDSHDRYANIEVSYLLQRMEAYRGLAILTSNMKGALDTAFLRRIRFVVEFPFPGAKERAEIWRRIFPRETPTQGLDARKLAGLNVAGGNIRNIALGAAFLAADLGEPVRMSHLLRAARSEYAKLERPLSGEEAHGWV